jgi:uncharacterized membrane protein
MDIASRNKLDDVIIRTKFSSLRWTTDNRGIFYGTYAGALDNVTSSTTSTENGKKIEENKVKILLFKFVNLFYFLHRQQMK